CHGAFKQQSELRLDTGAAIRKGGLSGAAVVPGKADESLLIQVVTGEAGFRMPPEDQGAALSEADVALLRAWVTEGAKSPADEEPQPDPRTWWSYRPIERPQVPAVQNTAWGRNAIDGFISAEHERRGLVPRPEAERSVWLRRMFLDLVGLPPTRDELHAFLNDASPHAYERVVDELLARPEYGQRWGRHWMDVWRYSDWYGSRGGNEIRYSQRHIWRWRDWIVDSLNGDKGYDRMVVEMLAGDEVAPTDPDVLRATGYLGRNWYKFDRDVWLFETIEHTAQAFLGLTLRCARCHDHKYDPVPQEEYYAFRAFFEPHDVRTDLLDPAVGTQKDPKFGEIPLDGLARVYDSRLDAPTYVYRRGDSRQPLKERVVSPAVPSALGGPELAVEAIALPPKAYYPELRDALIAGRLALARERISEAERAIALARTKAAESQRTLDDFAARVARGEASAAGPAPFLKDDFAEKSERWQIISGDWQWRGGHLAQTKVDNFATVVTNENHPPDFRVTLRYRTLRPGNYRSVGFSFDYVDQGHSQDVYTSTGDAAQSVQAFHREGGRQVYPPEAIVKTSLKVGEETTLEAEARGGKLSIRLNGEHKLDYQLPLARRDGRFALWVHSGVAEFLDVELSELAPTLESLRLAHQQALRAVALAEKDREIRQAELAALDARVAAEQAKYHSPPRQQGTSFEQLALAAGRAEKSVAVAIAERAVLEAETPGADASGSNAATKLAEAKQALEKAVAARDTADGTYQPLGEVYPATSTGRRLALARWIASPENPRTARVAVNHIWMRHFGEPLVESVANLGLNGKQPSHPELLDWLAAELIANDWRMKPLHRMIVLSSTYR
ncbi:MAG: DUF1549 domain-containing protein, partial [Planctomycetes bacterium]|nr:DUF1549 domain-containing protein [Planctomycetota bacterium]